MIPAVTVDVRLKGLPTAKTHSPILVWSESANLMYGKEFPDIFNTAISEFSSLPIISAIKVLLLFVVISISLAFSIT